MRSYKDFQGMDLNTTEKSISIKNPLKAMEMYNKRTGFGIREALEAMEEYLGMDPRVYQRVRERIAFSVFYGSKYGDFRSSLKAWRDLKRISEYDNKVKYILEDYYNKSDDILSLDCLEFNEIDPRND